MKVVQNCNSFSNCTIWYALILNLCFIKKIKMNELFFLTTQKQWHLFHCQLDYKIWLWNWFKNLIIQSYLIHYWWLSFNNKKGKGLLKISLEVSYFVAQKFNNKFTPNKMTVRHFRKAFSMEKSTQLCMIWVECQIWVSSYSLDNTNFWARCQQSNDLHI